MTTQPLDTPMAPHPLLSLFTATFLKFAGVGAFNTVLTLAIIFGLKAGLHWSDAGANLAGYAVGLASSFVLNRRWTFRGSAASAGVVGRFLLVFALAYALNIAVVLGAIGLGMHDYLAHLAGMPVYTIAFFIGCRDFVFVALPDRATRLLAPFAPQGAVGGYLAAAALMGFVLLYRLAEMPITLWDESRLANNALEMAQNGLSLVTTYDGLPDHWNTKPPLLIWFMALSIQLFGATELALRLPSVIAAFATGSLLFWFCAAHLKRPFVGFMAVVFLFTNEGYVMSHAARSGDYEALLTLWTTAYLIAGYMFTQAQIERRSLWMAACAAGIVLAFMTKTIQGLIFLPALCLYVGWKVPLRQTLRMRALYAGALGIAVVVVGYYVWREQLDPGYFQAARANDLGGRYTTVHEGHANSGFYYLLMFEYFPWMVLAPLTYACIARYGSDGRLRSAASFFLVVATFYFLIISTASTKLPWYATPLSPLAAIIMAIFVGVVRAPLEHAVLLAPRARRLLGAGAGAVAMALALSWSVEQIDKHASFKLATSAEDHHRFLKRLATGRGPRLHLVVQQPGYLNGQGDKFYVAPTLFYANQARAAGHTVLLQPLGEPLPAAATSLLSCDPGPYGYTWPGVTLVPAEARDGCTLYRIRRMTR